MPFWSKDKTAKRLDPNKYVPRAQRRLELVAQQMDKVQYLDQHGKADTRALTAILARLRELTEEQRNEVTLPGPIHERHKQGHLRIMEFQVRKLEDVLYNDGRNIDAILAEEDALHRQTHEELAQARQQNAERARSLGIAPPDFSKSSR